MTPDPSLQPILIVHRREFTIELWRWDEDVDRYELVRSYPVAIGQSAYHTPRGLYRIIAKGKNVDWQMPDSPWVAEEDRGKVIPGGDPRNPIKSRWMGFGEGRGIHGTADFASLGTAASHGCLRMAVDDVEELYSQVPVGTLLTIH